MMRPVPDTPLTLATETTTERGGYPYPTDADRRARLDALDNVLHLVRGNVAEFDARELVVLAQFVATGELLDFTPTALAHARAAVQTDTLDG